MLVALTEDLTSRVQARYVVSRSASYFCPKCRKDVILRKGRIRIPHFAHRPDPNCNWGLGESEEHRQCKTEIFDALLKVANVKNVILEHSIGASRPDVYAEIDNRPVAIEVQLSKLSLDEIKRRTNDGQTSTLHGRSLSCGYRYIRIDYEQINMLLSIGSDGCTPFNLASSIIGNRASPSSPSNLMSTSCGSRKANFTNKMENSSNSAATNAIQNGTAPQYFCLPWIYAKTFNQSGGLLMKSGNINFQHAFYLVAEIPGNFSVRVGQGNTKPPSRYLGIG